jgi:hypothetical protein
VHLGLPFIPGPGSEEEIKRPSWSGRDADERLSARRLGHPIGDGLPPFEIVRSFLVRRGGGRVNMGLVEHETVWSSAARRASKRRLPGSRIETAWLARVASIRASMRSGRTRTWTSMTFIGSLAFKD